MDVLAEVLATTRVGAAIYGRVELRAPFAMHFDRVDKAGFHLVERGSCVLTPARGAAIALHQGDVVMLPRGWTHTIADRRATTGIPYSQVLVEQAKRQGAPTAVLICGAYAFDHDQPHPLLAVLPDVMHAVATGSLRSVAELLSSEIGSAAPGAESAARRLLDVLFLYVLRDWLGRQPEGAAGWLGALRDPTTERALTALHQAPAREWSLPRLAKAIGVSRATLARRFTKFVGHAPLAYLRQWRMTLAAQALRERNASLAELATLAGYESEAAFHKAFTRERGVTPGAYRRIHAGAQRRVVDSRRPL
jgi:AraC-like DNA-binding protein